MLILYKQNKKQKNKNFKVLFFQFFVVDILRKMYEKKEEKKKQKTKKSPRPLIDDPARDGLGTRHFYTNMNPHIDSSWAVVTMMMMINAILSFFLSYITFVFFIYLLYSNIYLCLFYLIFSCRTFNNCLKILLIN